MNKLLTPTGWKDLSEAKKPVSGEKTIERQYHAGALLSNGFENSLKRAKFDGHNIRYFREKRGLGGSVFTVHAPKYIHDQIADHINKRKRNR